jgi:predicted PurR-regulated permease PerM
MSIGEQAGKAAQSTIDALKSTPVVLALVVFNLLFVGAMVFVSVKSGERWDREIERWAGLAKSCQDRTSP